MQGLIRKNLIYQKSLSFKTKLCLWVHNYAAFLIGDFIKNTNDKARNPIKKYYLLVYKLFIQILHTFIGYKWLIYYNKWYGTTVTSLTCPRIYNILYTWHASLIAAVKCYMEHAANHIDTTTPWVYATISLWLLCVHNSAVPY